MSEVPPVYDPPPDPPIIATRSYLLFGALGVLHLILAVLAECLQMLNLVLGLVEILIAIWIALAVARWQKQRDDWIAKQKARIMPQAPPPTGS